MGYYESRPRYQGYEHIAAFIVVPIMVALYLNFSGPLTPDWLGYQDLFETRGGYLIKIGRDRSFIWLLGLAQDLSGHNGYGAFRDWVFAFFTGAAVFLVYRLKTQVRIEDLSPLVTAAVVVTVLTLKSLVQIREGIAFVLVMAPLGILAAGHRIGIILTLLASVVAFGFHAGSAVFGVIWFLAAIVTRFGRSALQSKGVHRLALICAAIAGYFLALAALNDSAEAEFLLRDMSVYRASETITGVWKLVYWAANGVLVLCLRRQLLDAAYPDRPFLMAYACVIASVVMPMIYTLCAVLVFESYYLPAVTATVIRLFLTVTETALLLIAMIGRANLFTAIMTIFMFVDRFRLVVPIDEWLKAIP